MRDLKSSFGIVGRLAIFISLLSTMVGFYVYGQQVHASNAIIAHPIYAGPQYTPAEKGAKQLFKCQAASAKVKCYTPQQVRAAYAIQPLLDAGVTGKGHTIVIVDAFQSPTIANDLKTFDQTFGLSDPTLNIIAPQGLTSFNPKDSGQVSWAGEISLDVEYAHVIAPNATIDLVLAKTNMDVDIYNATKYAVDNSLGDVISMSFGEAESCIDPKLLPQQHALFQVAANKHITLVASSGDQGAAQPTCDGSSYFQSASTPASDPLVTSVGATHLDASVLGAYIGESAWNDQYGASGGGYSSVYPRPSYQDGVVSQAHRGIPDVAYLGDTNGGVLAVWSSSGNGTNHVFIFGGTSVGSPNWAGLTVLANQSAGHLLGFLNTAIYKIAASSAYAKDFHDITSGNNSVVVTDAKGNPVKVAGFNTTTGWDAVTGVGSPIGTALVPALAGH